MPSHRLAGLSLVRRISIAKSEPAYSRAVHSITSFKGLTAYRIKGWQTITFAAETARNKGKAPKTAAPADDKPAIVIGKTHRGYAQRDRKTGPWRWSIKRKGVHVSSHKGVTRQWVVDRIAKLDAGESVDPEPPTAIGTKHYRASPKADRRSREDGTLWYWRFRERGKGGREVRARWLTTEQAQDTIEALERSHDKPDPAPIPEGRPGSEGTAHYRASVVRAPHEGEPRWYWKLAERATGKHVGGGRYTIDEVRAQLQRLEDAHSGSEPDATSQAPPKPEATAEEPPAARVAPSALPEAPAVGAMGFAADSAEVAFVRSMTRAMQTPTITALLGRPATPDDALRTLIRLGAEQAKKDLDFE